MKPASARSRIGRLRRASSRYAMTAIAALSLLSFLSIYAHLVLVQHTTCPEHGELIDRPDGAAPGIAADDTQTHPPAHAAWHDRSAADAHSHHHCELVPKRREALATPPSAAPYLAPPADRPVASAPRAALLPPAIAVLRLAPKQSPPA